MFLWFGSFDLVCDSPDCSQLGFFISDNVVYLHSAGSGKNLLKMGKVTFKLKKSGCFYGKIQVVPHKSSVGKFNYNKDIDGYDVQHVMCVSFLQVFFLWFIFEIKLPLEAEGMAKQQYIVYHKKDERKLYSNIP